MGQGWSRVSATKKRVMDKEDKTTDVYFNEVRIEDRVYWNDICELHQWHCKHNVTMYSWLVLTLTQIKKMN